jgi:small subunit ribosomal protein S4
MSRYRGPRIRIVRRLGSLSGLTRKVTEREQTPGQHGKPSTGRRSVSDYTVRLEEKQKLRFNYGISEKQLVGYVKEARRLKGSTGTLLLQLLEMRLDNIVFRLGLAPTIPAARQVVSHGHILVNNQKVNIPSFQCNPGDLISVRPTQTSKKLINTNLETSSSLAIPSHLEFEPKTLSGNVKGFVERNEIGITINDLLIVEYYSRK